MARKLFSRQARERNAIKEAEELAKLRRPSQMSFGEETGTSVPFNVPGTATRQQIAGLPTATRTAQTFEPTEYPITEDLGFEAPPMEQGQGQSQPGEGIRNFINQLMQSTQPQVVGSAPDGGAVLSDNTVVYQDGSMLNEQGERVYPMGSAPGGNLVYSDNIVRSGGLQSLIQMIFGQDRVITQEYGNINPIEPTPGNVNTGTDIRTRDLMGQQREIRLPFDARVVQVLEDDGTRFGDRSGHQGYGNSVLVALPTGEMLRFSHLSDKGQFQVGDTLPAWTTIGRPGTTGNTYGEHLDLEYYNQEGKIDNPENFKAPAEIVKRVTEPQNGQVLGATTEQPELQAQPQAPQPSQFTSPVETKTADYIEQTKPTGNFDFGVSETLRGDIPQAKEKQAQTIENVGTQINAPELFTGELSRAQGTMPIRQAGGNLLDLFSQKLQERGIKLPEMNISEAIAGGKTFLSDGAKDLLQPPQAQASEPMQSFITEPPKPGKGIQKLQGQVLGSMDVQSRPTSADIGERRAVGEASSNQTLMSSIPMDSAQTQQAKTGTDIRDPFFRLGLDKKFGDYLSNTKEKRAVSLDLFKPNFFENTGRIDTALKGTNLFAPAQQKYQDLRQQKINEYRNMYSGGDYDQGDMEAIINSLPSNADLSAMSIRAPKYSYADAYSPSSGGDSGGQSSGGQSYPAVFSGPNQNASQSPASKSYPAVFSGPKQNASPAPKPPMSQMSSPSRSSSPAPKPQPQQNVFSKAISYISNLFRR